MREQPQEEPNVPHSTFPQLERYSGTIQHKTTTYWNAGIIKEELFLTQATSSAECEALWMTVADVEQLCDRVLVQRRVGIDKDGHLVDKARNLQVRCHGHSNWFNEQVGYVKKFPNKATASFVDPTKASR